MADAKKGDAKAKKPEGKAPAQPSGKAEPKSKVKKAGPAADGKAALAVGLEPARLMKQYREQIVPDLMKKFEYKSVMQVPRISKITLNMGVGDAVNDKKNIDAAYGDMMKIAGQKPVVTKARKAIANF